MFSTTDGKDHQGHFHINDPKELEGAGKDKLEDKGQDKLKNFEI